jgi:hypothetical protein
VFKKSAQAAIPRRHKDQNPAIGQERVAVRFARVQKERKGRDPAAPQRPESRDWAERVAVRFARFLLKR